MYTNVSQASKAALISFYESLKFEVSPTITITILTLGYIQTNLITAKYSSNGVGVRLRKVSNVGSNCNWSIYLASVAKSYFGQDMKDVVPTMEAEPCVKAVVDGIRKGAMFITEPRFMKALFLIKYLFPHLHQFYFNMYFPSKNRNLKRDG